MVERSKLLLPKEVAEIMRVSDMTIYRLIEQGKLPATRVGRSYRIWEKDVEKYLNDGYTG